MNSLFLVLMLISLMLAVSFQMAFAKLGGGGGSGGNGDQPPIGPPGMPGGWTRQDPHDQTCQDEARWALDQKYPGKHVNFSVLQAMTQVTCFSSLFFVFNYFYLSLFSF
jgi:hypothetical protein